MVFVGGVRTIVPVANPKNSYINRFVAAVTTSPSKKFAIMLQIAATNE